MSQRELKALLKDSSGSGKTYLRTRGMTSLMDNLGGDTLHEQVSGAQGSDSSASELQSLRHLLEQASQNEDDLKCRIAELEKEAEFSQTRMELQNLRTMEAQRQEFQQQLQREWDEIGIERRRTDALMQGVSNLAQNEKHFYEKRIQTLENELRVAQQSQKSGGYGGQLWVSDRRGWSHEGSEESESGCGLGMPGGRGRSELDSRCGLEMRCKDEYGDSEHGHDTVGHEVQHAATDQSGNEQGMLHEGDSERERVAADQGCGRLRGQRVVTFQEGQGCGTRCGSSEGAERGSGYGELGGGAQDVGDIVGGNGEGRRVQGGSSAEGRGSTSAGGQGVSLNLHAGLPVARQQPAPTVAARTVVPDLPGGLESSPLLIQSMSKLLQSQTDMLSAQAQAVAVQGLPPLGKFSGENLESKEDGFDLWLEAFEERAHLAGWTATHQLYQLKIHLERTALQVFRMIPDDKKKVYSEVVSHLKKRFKPVDIEELKGMEFHQLMQGTQSIEKLGIDLQKLGRKAFPGTTGKEFDRLLKGRFFQALHCKWQRKLGAPKTGETFGELYDRARTLERHDQQFTESAVGREKASSTGGTQARGTGGYSVVRGEQGSGRSTSSRGTNVRVNTDAAPPQVRQGTTPTPSKQETGPLQPRYSFPCHKCRKVGHYARDCPTTRGGKAEATGHSTSRAATLTASPAENASPLSGFTVEQLEQHIAERKVSSESALMLSASRKTAKVDVVHSDIEVSSVVGPTPYLELTVEGVPVQALVDTGSQSTIISRHLLHEVARKLRLDGKQLPELTQPAVRLYGKDGQTGQRELDITAQLELTLLADGKKVRVPVFVQPDSEQTCLLGMNAIPQLGLRMLRGNGSPLCAEFARSDVSSHGASSVRLVQTATIPGRKGRFVDAVMDTGLEGGTEVLFEPDTVLLKELGLSSSESLLTAGPGGRLLIPLQNYRHSAVAVEGELEVGMVQVVGPDQVRPEGSTALRLAEVDPDQPESGVVNLVSSDQGERCEGLKKVLNLPREGLKPGQVKELERFLLESEDVFSLDQDDLGCTSLVCHKVDTGDHAPIKQAPRRLPFCRRKVVSDMIEEMSKKGIVQPSSSAWASPIVLVPKRDNTLRFCVDYRKVNAVTKRDVYPLPRIDDILDTLGKSSYFTTLDLASGYWQIAMDPATREKSAFASHCGLHEFVRMPFGMCNAPATFQRLMQVVLAGIEWKYCFVYLDDILICSKTFEEHLEHLREVLRRLRKAGLTLKPKKCFFMQLQVNYLGHVISRDGVSPDPEKTRKVRDFPVPSDVTRVRQFLGLASYYRRFVLGFAAIAGPLNWLLKKDIEFVWTRECQQAFDTLKEALISAPVLVYPRFGDGEEFVLETDASLEGLGAVLGQKQDDGHVHPVAYASRSLNVHEKNYCITELETLGLVWAVKHFRPYLLGHHSTVLTDHSACTSLLNASRPSAKLARWAMIVQEFDLEIKHRSGKSNTNADALSRNPAESRSLVLAVQTSSLDDAVEFEQTELIEEQAKDAELVALLQYVREGVIPDDQALAKRLALESTQLDVINGVLHHENPHQPGEWRIVVPVGLRVGLMKEMHGGRFSGHFAWKKLYVTLRKRFWWKGMCGDVERFCKCCLECVSRKGTGRAVRPPLASIPMGGPFHRVGVDVLQLPVTESGNKYVVVFAYYLTKWVEAFAVPDQTAVTIARLLVEEVFCRHGAPEHLLSDRGANFLSELVLEVCKHLQIKKLNTSGYHPQTNGLVEKFNSTLIGMISKVAESSGRDWDRHLPFLLFAYRVSIHSSTHESPFYLIYGRDARIPSETVLHQTTSPYLVDVDDYRHVLTDNLSTAWALAKEHIKGAQQHQKEEYDKKAKDHQFKVGDRVMVHMPGAVTGKAWKLARPYHGPYRILKVTPTNIEARLVDDVDAESIFVAVNRVRMCSTGLSDTSWTGPRRKRRKRKKIPTENTSDHGERTGPVTRSRSATTG